MTRKPPDSTFVDLSVARRAEVFAPRLPDELFELDNGNMAFEDDLSYSSGREEPTLLVSLGRTLQTLDHHALLAYLAVCTAWVTHQTEDIEGETWVVTTPYALARWIAGGDGRDHYRRAARALETLRRTEIHGIGWFTVARHKTVRGKTVDVLERVQGDVHTQLIAEWRSVKEHDADRHKTVRIALPPAIRQALDSGAVAKMPSDAVRTLSRSPAALRLYLYAQAQMAGRKDIAIAAVVAEQIIRPAPSWSLRGKRPSIFRRQVQEIARKVEVADPSIRARLVAASEVSGAWKIVLTRAETTV